MKKENLFQKAYNKAEKYFLERASIQQLNVQSVIRGDAKSPVLDIQPEDLQAKTLKEWKIALMMATDLEYPDRSFLQNLYKNLLLDNHLASTIESRILHSQRAPFKIVDNAGNENEDLTDLLQRPWFEEFIHIALESRFEGTQLIELFELSKNTKELKEIERIPIGHFNPMKGVILKSPGDADGWPYKDGPLTTHYIQIGKNRDLGMLAEIAPVVLGKKLGWGSWLDYLEKYGVGNLFITTEHQDIKSIERLQRAAQNFKALGWMVTNGNEKFEIKGNEAGNPENFNLLIERANSEISKRILGGSGLTDEKAYVGSAKIQFQLAKDRYDSDLLLLKNIINQELLPRLVKISPVYAPFAHHYFEYEEDQEDANELTKRIASLAPYFEMDVEELSQRTGITLLKQRRSNFQTEEEVKKKARTKD